MSETIKTPPRSIFHKARLLEKQDGFKRYVVLCSNNQYVVDKRQPLAACVYWTSDEVRHA